MIFNNLIRVLTACAFGTFLCSAECSDATNGKGNVMTVADPEVEALRPLQDKYVDIGIYCASQMRLLCTAASYFNGCMKNPSWDQGMVNKAYGVLTKAEGMLPKVARVLSETDNLLCTLCASTSSSGKVSEAYVNAYKDTIVIRCRVCFYSQLFEAAYTYCNDVYTAYRDVMGRVFQASAQAK